MTPEKFAWVTAVGTCATVPDTSVVVSKLPALARVVAREGRVPIVVFLPEYCGTPGSEWGLRRSDGDRWRAHTLETLPGEATAALMREALAHERR